MFRAIVAFELRYQRRQPLLWGAAALFAMLGFVATGFVRSLSYGERRRLR